MRKHGDLFSWLLRHRSCAISLFPDATCVFLSCVCKARTFLPLLPQKYYMIPWWPDFLIWHLEGLVMRHHTCSSAAIQQGRCGIWWVLVLKNPPTCMHLNDSLSLWPHLIVFSGLKITSPTPRGLTHTGIKTVVVRWITLQLHTCCSHGFRKGILQLFTVTESVTTKSILFLKHLGPDPTNTSLLTYWKWVMNITICSRRLLINCNFIWKINSRVYIQ